MSDTIPVSTASGVIWDFVIPSEATTCSEQAIEMIDVCTRLFGTFGDFLTPIELQYGIAVFSVDRAPPFGEDTTEPMEIVKKDLRDESGLTAAEFVDSTEIEYPGVRFMPRVPIDHNQLKIRDSSGDRVIDRTDCVAYSKGERINQQPSWDPLKLVVTYTPNTQHEDIDTEYNVHARVTLQSGIWIEQTPSGNINQKYLSGFLESIDEKLPVERVEREVYSMSDFWPDLGLQQHSESFDPRDIY